jgi:hypothetical protein
MSIKIADITRFSDRPGRAIREAVSGCSSGPVYYETKGHAFIAVCEVLNGHGLTLQCVNLDGDSGRALLDVYPLDSENAGPVGYVNFSWYRMQSGRYELTVYVA